jgi:hypothetical protein
MNLFTKKINPFRRVVGFSLIFLLLFSGLIATVLQNPTNASATGTTFVQGQAVGTGSQVTSTAVTMSKAVNNGDLLVGVFLQYNSTGQVHVSDNVNGAWTRAGGETFSTTAGDVALYYKANAAGSPSGVKITVSADKATYLQAAVSEYSGIATTNSFSSLACSKGAGTSASSGSTATIPQGDLVFAGLQTGGSPSAFTSGSSQGIAFVKRASSSSGTEGVEDILSSNAGTQTGTFTLSKSTDWYTCAGVLNPQALAPIATATPTLAPTATLMPTPTATPTPSLNPTATPTAIPTPTSIPSPTSTITPTPTAIPTPTSTPIPTPTPTTAPILTQSQITFVQAQALSPGNKFSSEQIVFANPVKAGDLLVGWFAQYDASGQVSVSDNVNGAWTRATSEHFSNGGGDLALYYKLNSAPSSNLVITVSANGSTYLPYAVSEYSGLSATASLDQTAVASATGTHEVAGPTASISAGELVFGAEITGGIPASFTVGSSQGVSFIKRATNIDSGSTGVEDVLSSASGPQNSDFTISSSTDWYSLVATFKP